MKNVPCWIAIVQNLFAMGNWRLVFFHLWVTQLSFWRFSVRTPDAAPSVMSWDFSYFPQRLQACWNVTSLSARQFPFEYSELVCRHWSNHWCIKVRVAVSVVKWSAKQTPARLVGEEERLAVTYCLQVQSWSYFSLVTQKTRAWTLELYWELWREIDR